VTVLWVALAGAAGVCSRYAVGLLAPSLWATLAINVVGSLLLGILVEAGRELPSAVRAALGVGFLGGFTTFSTFSVQAVAEVEAGRPETAALYVTASVALGLLAAAVGYGLGRALTG